MLHEKRCSNIWCLNQMNAVNMLLSSSTWTMECYANFIAWWFGNNLSEKSPSCHLNHWQTLSWKFVQILAIGISQKWPEQREIFFVKSKKRGWV